ncbi:cytochrome P450 [Westerdykella ornata]|uniref:Cytochrome P450 n=1 Tax=Westerdykella ornata TaxID=318751 RepID=A0A6A6JF48_WESOR|nr:cytochrome P450 [Westerdykella ornata]KAF2274864.1 cytochrome P450 [Westerdykella ornata]
MAVYFLENLNAIDVLKTVGIGLILYPILTVIYNITLHPLSRFPGPLLWGCSRLRYMYSSWSGWLHSDVAALHEKYGNVVRVAPNELSFADPRVWEDIYSNRGSSPAFPKSPVWHGSTPGKPDSLANLISSKRHAAMRRKMEPGFTERAVGQQEEIVQGFVGLLMQKLKGKCEESDDGSAAVDVVKWFTFVTMDIITDLSFGESFHLLEKEELDDWVGVVVNSMRVFTIMATLRNYPWLNWLLQKLIPASARRKADWHWHTVMQKVDQRLAEDTRRPDFLSLWQRDDKGGDGLEKGHVYANAFIMTVAGSETSAGTLTGTLNKLLKHPEILERLTKEVRSRFAHETEITFAALKELPYLNAVMSEGLRVCSVVPGLTLPRITPPSGGIVCGYRVPGNIFVGVHVHSTMTGSRYFFESTEFRPERWLAEVNQDPSSPYFHDQRNGVQPFGIGPRSCIGKPLALAEMRLILARLVWTFDIGQAESEAGKVVWEDQRAFTVIDKKPFEVRLRPRVQ